MTREEVPGNVVKEVHIGNSVVYICDDYCRDKTPEDVRKILDRIVAKVQPEMERIEYERMQREQKASAVAT